ncbi:SusC/RagA family TonB-linked outer membrane protein [Adhaeribacter rhizoryzae]|uniref:TonB-dependent receptor n=1 Tax=Adhaeribacter rhizoryzae TaxID=2607907 RepID=A0A5M6DRG3_9BACT|nr:TonB-dependent receptor [Adhaeribacter rhizoryzae]KAA5548842.1 TonB-dependent receptor [Adhaeribacter rhizoryzae]
MLKPLRKLPLLMLVIWSAGLMPPARAQVLTALNRGLTKQRSTGKESSRQSLAKILTAFEKQHNITFNYDSELLLPIVSDLKALEGQTKNIDESLTKLLAPHQLTFEKISANDYIIVPVRPQPKPAEKPLSKPSSGILVDKVISGKVTSAKGEGLPGVTVLLKGTSVGATTGSGGDYTLSVPDAGGTLIFSFIGFATKEVAVPPAGGTLNITLEEDAKALEEVVVVGFGTQKKVNLTGAVATVSSEALTSRPIGQTSAALQGVAPGVTVTQSSGRPGGDAGTIRIRGIGTLSDSNPLVLIDGIEGSINNIDPNLIESISVLKDAASASIYGSRAANGVILVTTKRAKGNQLSIGYNGYGGFQTPTNMPDMVNAIDHMLLTNEAYVNVGRAALYSDALIDKYRTEGPANRDLYPDTDWQKEVITGSGAMQSHFISLNGGGEKIRFLTSLGYFDQQGLIESSNFKRFTLRNNADILFSDKFNMKFDLQLVSAHTTEPGRGTSDVFHWMNRIPANQLGINSDGTWGEGWNGDNPIAFSRIGGERKNNSPSAQLNVSLNYTPAEWLQLELTAAPRFAQSNNSDFNRSVQTYKPNGAVSFLVPARSTLTEERNQAFYNNFRGTLTATKTLGGHGLKLLLGASREDYRNNIVSAFRDNFILPDYPVLNTGSANNQQARGGGAEWALQSFFGRINYDYNQKYLLEVNGRYDGSSRFATGNKYGFFPSVSAGWRISEEAFMEPLKNVVNELKFRGSWGRLGNQNIGNYPFTSFINLGSYTLGKQIVNTAALNTLANSDISWETTEMTDFGIDLTLLDNLSFTGDYYFRQTRDILYTLDVPLIIGLAAPSQNVGVVNNTGWEMGLTYRGAVKDFNYDVSFNLSDVINEVVDLRGVNRTGLTVSREGNPINSIFGLEAEGFFQSEDEVAAHAKQFGTIKPGDIKYKDQNNDGIINDNDNVIIGSTIPRLTFGTTINATYKGFNLNVFFQGVGKSDGFLWQQGIMPFFLGGTVQEQHKDHWTPATPNATFPRLAFSEANNEKVSRFWLKDASYLRLKNLQLGYKLPTSLVQRVGMKNLRLYVNGQNLFTLDKFWKGYDVETPVGIGNGYPQVKVYSFGVDVNF